MQDLTEIEEREFVLDESIKELDCVNKKLAKLLVRKEELTELVIAALGHEKEGQKTYEYTIWKIEVRTPFVYSLNKKRYEAGDYLLPSDFNPIKESKSYSIDKRACEEYLTTAPKWVRDALIELIDKKPGKPSVIVKENV